jgi:hypothetical protein
MWLKPMRVSGYELQSTRRIQSLSDPNEMMEGEGEWHFPSSYRHTHFLQPEVCSMSAIDVVHIRPLINVEAREVS